MRPAAHVQATIELLDELAASPTPADRLMAGYFKQRRYIGSKDKAAISENFYAVLRQKLSLEYQLDQLGLGVHSRMLVALLKKIEGGDLSALFNGDRYSPTVLRPEQIEAFSQMPMDLLEQAPLNVRLNVPEWLAPKLQAALGDRYEAEMAASNQRATTDIRVNTLKSSVGQVSKVLSNVGYNATPTNLSPWGIRFESRVALFGLDAFRQGWFEVQDEGSQLLALVSGVKAGQKVVDFCAGAGGKTLAMAAMMENKGTIYACDVHSKRLLQLSKRSKRAGVHNVRTHVLSSEHDKWVKKHAGVADVVLIDAPCTGTGTWRRSPDSRWNLSRDNVRDLVALQQSILDSACRLVKSGGKLIYATCSLLQEENEQQIVDFLQRNEEFKAGSYELPNSLVQNSSQFSSNGYELRTFPDLSQTDGFYAASLDRRV